MKAVVAAFNQEKALVGAFCVITNLRMEIFEALPGRHATAPSGAPAAPTAQPAAETDNGAVKKWKIKSFKNVFHAITYNFDKVLSQ